MEKRRLLPLPKLLGILQHFCYCFCCCFWMFNHSIYETSCQYCYLFTVILISMSLLSCSISMNELIHHSWVLTTDDQPSAAASKESFSAHTSHPSRPMWLSCFIYNRMTQTAHNHKHKTPFDKTFKHNKDGILILTRQNHNPYFLLYFCWLNKECLIFHLRVVCHIILRLKMVKTHNFVGSGKYFYYFILRL